MKLASLLIVGFMSNITLANQTVPQWSCSAGCGIENVSIPLVSMANTAGEAFQQLLDKCPKRVNLNFGLYVAAPKQFKTSATESDVVYLRANLNNACVKN